MTRCQILLPTAFSSALTYAVPEGMSVTRGEFVRVPLGRRTLTGVVWEEAGDETVPAAKLKYITEQLPILPLSMELLDFIRWVAAYTMSPLGMVLKMALSSPEALEPVKGEVLYRLGDITGLRSTPARAKVIAYLKGQEETITGIVEATGVTSAVVHGMVKCGALEVVANKPSPPKQTCHPEQPDCSEAEGAGTKDLPVKEYTPSVGRSFTSAPLRVGSFRMTEHATPPTLSADQQHAADALIEATHTGYSVTLLDGVTGSGKTEVYCAAIAKVLEEGGQALIMLPEIVLTTQLLTRFEKRFGIRPAIWHSDITKATKRDSWRGIQDGSVSLVVGARSSLFLPFANLKLIVVDEEHETAYKQEEGVVYHARDMAIVRALKEQIPIILASATPSVETMANVLDGKYRRVHLGSRHGEASLPDIRVIDMRGEQLDRQTWISPSLRTALAESVSAGEQAMLFLNRRGYAPLTLCRGCGHRFECPHCTSWLVEHRHANRASSLQCHQCGYTTTLPAACPACGAEAEKLAACGPGVERLVEEVKAFLPSARICQMTSDTITTSKQAEAVMRAIIDGEVDIIIGTQMIAKGLHFPNLQLVGIVDADLGLSGGDPRAVERTYQLLHQVAGRAGREAQHGRVFIQSYMPDNTALVALKDDARDAFLAGEIASRKRTHIPPFGRLASIIISGKREEEVVSIAKWVARNGSSLADIQLLGPAPAPIYQIRGKFRYRLLFKAKKAYPIQKAVFSALQGIKTPADVRLKIDIDPCSFL